MWIGITQRTLGIAVLALTLDAGSGTQPAGLATIATKDAKAWVEELSSPWFEGRDSPSATQDLAAAWIARKLESFGLATIPGGEGFLHPFQRTVRAPDPDNCRLELGNAPPAVGTTAEKFELAVDFVPVPSAEGEASGPLVFAGFGIAVPGYDELKGLPLKGAIALIFEGEPRHPKTLEGAELSPAANLYRKLSALAALGAAGAIVVRRDPPGDPPRPEGFPPITPLGFRFTWASWQGERPEITGPSPVPAVEVSLAAAERLAGVALGPVVEDLDKRGRPKRFELPAGVDGTPRTVRIGAKEVERAVAHPNVIGVVPGRDPERANEWLVLGAHLDHLGVDPRTRVGMGADDNASGSAAALLVARALMEAKPRRPVLVCFFSAEEDGLLGAGAMLDAPVVPIESMAFMLNLDMIGRGPKDSVVVLGVQEYTPFDRVLQRARRLGTTGIKTVETRGGQELWERSDHFQFFKRGVPVLFFFEDVPITKNRDYHTWRDTPDQVDAEKVARGARLAFNTLWLIGEDDDLPTRPGR